MNDGKRTNHDFLQYYSCRDGNNVAADFFGVRVPDVDLWYWFRGLTNSRISIKDLSLSRDKRYMQPLLYFFARTYHAKHILEIGMADGSTTWPLLKAVSEVFGGHVDSVDTASCVMAHNLVEMWNLTDLWTHHQMTSDSYFANVHGDKTIEFAYIDGDHSYRGVYNDLKNVLDHLVPGGIIFMDEYQVDVEPEAVLLPKDRSSLAASYGTPRAVADLINEYDCDIMPLTFGCFGLKRFPEWTEGGEVMIRKRLPTDWQPMEKK